jgi:phage baseplate assembly protein W
MPRIQTLSDSNTLDINSEVTSRNILWSDFSLSMIPSVFTKDITRLTDLDALSQSVKNLILTRRGERPFSPNLGSDIYALLFEPIDKFTSIDMRDAIIETLANYEPRVDIIDLVVSGEEDKNRYSVTLAYKAKNEEVAREISFYLDRVL